MNGHFISHPNNFNFTKADDNFKCNLLLNAVNLCNFSQYSFVKNHLNRTLDLVFSNINCSVTNSLDSLVNIDRHHPVWNISFNIIFDYNRVSATNITTFHD